MSIDLKKYLDANHDNYTKIYSQTIEKSFDSGWLAYVLPRMVDDCNSERSKYYGLTSTKEAKAFWKNQKLRNYYVHILKAMNNMTRDEFNSVYVGRAKEKIKQSIDVFLPISKEFEGLEEDVEILESFIEKFYN